MPSGITFCISAMQYNALPFWLEFTIGRATMHFPASRGGAVWLMGFLAKPYGK